MKAILIVDIPDDYQEYGSGDWYVVGNDLRIVYEEDGALKTYKYIDDDMAELKPMPIKQEAKFTIGIDLVDGFKDGWNYGWNACIEAILGEEE